MDPATDQAVAPPNGTGSSIKSDDYVWDVFYHRPATLSEWNDAANIGTLCVPVLTT